MDEARINRALARLASEIVEENHGLTDLVLVGVRRRGVPLANRIADKIQDLEGTRPPVGILDITLYRDDLSTVGAKPIVSGTELPGDIEGRTIVLVDDVLYTGRTVRAEGRASFVELFGQELLEAAGTVTLAGRGPVVAARLQAEAVRH